ncbi:MAG: MaoC family dehydratase [Pseudomonadales bacterium]|nr:MaoC family dehydratase [Pseudomonadales bacterium]MCP5182664.1 MaoC family dehydratase [Pseudomonadales bacterium]
MSDDDFRARARLWPKGNRFEDFGEGRVFDHHWGRTITAGDNAAFTTRTLSFCPLYFNEPYAQAQGHPRTVVNPLLVFNTVFGLTVEDLSEGGGPFLGVDKCHFLAPVYVGDTLTARSTVVSARESKGNAAMGIVAWHTQGFNQHGEQVIDYVRTNLVRKRRTAS